MKMEEFVQKHILKILIILAIIGAVFCLYRYLDLRSEEGYETERYGLVSEKSITMDDDKIVRVDFQLTKEKLKGIFVYLNFSGEMNNNEKLQFRLYDKGEEEIIGEYEMELMYEASGQYVFVPLPLEDSQDRDVFLMIEGKNIINKPILYMSSDKDLKSVLTIDGAKKSRSLVMQTAYENVVNNGNPIIIEYLLYILILVTCGWISSKREIKIKKIKFINICNTPINKIFIRIKSIVKKYNKIIECIGIAFLLCALFLFIYEVAVEDVISDKKVINCISTSGDSELVIDKNTKILKQTVLAEETELSAVMLKVRTESVSTDSKVLFQIYDKLSNKELYNNSLQLGELKGELKLEVNELYKNSINREILIQVTPVNFTEDKLYIEASEKEMTDTNELLINLVHSKYDLAIKMEHHNFDDLFVLYIIFAFFLTLLVYMVYYLFRICRKSIVQAYIPVVLFVGVLYCFVITPYGVPDESSHIETVYRFTNHILGIPDSEKPKYAYKRVSDVDILAVSNSAERTSVNKYSYLRMFQQIGKLAEDETLVECYTRDNTNNASWFYYFPMIIGMAIGRLLHFNALTIILLGRLCSVIVFSLCSYFVIKKLPVLKITFFLLSLFPMTMQQVASYSYDTIIIIIASLYIAYCLDFIYSRKESSMLDVMLTIILGTMLAQVKGGSYVPITFLLVVLLVRYFKNNLKKCLGAFAMLFVFTFAFLKRNILTVIGLAGRSQGDAVGGASNQELYTLSYLLEHPKKLILLYANTLFERGDYYLQTMLGGKLAWLNLEISWVYLIAILILVLISLGIKEENSIHSVRITLFERTWYLIVAVGSFVLVILSMLLVWTNMSEVIVTGVQGRYFLPALFVFLLVFKNRLLEHSKIKDIHLVCAMVIVQVLVLLRIMVVAI